MRLIMEIQMRLKRLWHEIKINRTLYFLMLPFLIFFVTFAVYPVLQAIYYSFTDYNVLEPANFIGLLNYKKLFLEDTIFIKAIQNTFIIAVFVGAYFFFKQESKKEILDRKKKSIVFFEYFEKQNYGERNYCPIYAGGDSNNEVEIADAIKKINVPIQTEIKIYG